MTPKQGTRVRMSREARRTQLIELGLEMLRTRPLEEISIEVVAEAAGVSRALLFHYFDSKQDFHVAVAGELGRQLLERTEPDPAADPIEALRGSMAAYLDYVCDHPEAYQALVRGAASTDPRMREVADGTRAVMTRRILDRAPALGVPTGPVTELTVAGWLAFVEETTLRWLRESTLDRADFERVITVSLPALAMVVVDPLASN